MDGLPRKNNKEAHKLDSSRLIENTLGCCCCFRGLEFRCGICTLSVLNPAELLPRMWPSCQTPPSGKKKQDIQALRLITQSSRHKSKPSPGFKNFVCRAFTPLKILDGASPHFSRPLVPQLPKLSRSRLAQSRDPSLGRYVASQSSLRDGKLLLGGD